MANAHFYSNTAVETTLAGSISAGATSISVGATTGFPGSFPYTLALDYGAGAEELVSVTAAAATTLTVTRGFSGTSAQSHSLGAVVRHVYHAGDATDFRTHEAASAAVHGITGSVVGTSDTQTLANKTLTAPAITAPVVTGGGSLAGTFTGTPTFSGAVVLSGTPSISSGAALAGTFSGTPTFSGNLSFSGSPTFSGGATFSSAITVTNTFSYSRSDPTFTTINHRVTGDGSARLVQQAGGTLLWGSGSASGDTNLYRSAADTLKTDDSFDVGTNLSVTGNATITGTIAASNISTGAITTYTPTWTSDGGSTSVGNGSLAGYYYKVGRLVHFWIKLGWGSTTSSTGTQWHFSLPVAVGQADNTLFVVHAWGFDNSSSNRYMANGYVNDTDGDVQAICASASATFWDQGDPFTWANGDRLNLWGFYEAAT